MKKEKEKALKTVVGDEKVLVCKIMGVDIAALDMQELVSIINNNYRELSGNYICVSNVHTVVTSFENEDYRNIQNCAAMAIPDGGPLSFVGRKRGFKNMRRTTGPDLMDKIFSDVSLKSCKHLFFGSTEKTLEKMRENILKRYPWLNIVDMISPPFGAVSEEKEKEYVDRINNANADFIWVGLGAPKQEVWMFNHKSLVHGLMIGVGAGFDYYAGNIKRAPKWMQKMCLEWLYRLFQNPKRLFKRYLHTNPKFIWHAIIRGR